MRIALITGGAGGIGSAITRKLAAEGYAILITYKSNAKRASSLIDALENSETHGCYRCNLEDSKDIERVAAEIAKKYGALHLLINNAGITTPISHDDLDALSDEWIDKIFQTNFRGSFAMVRAFKKLLLKGSAPDHPSLVVNVSSVAGKTGIGSNVAYCASKAAIDSMTRSLGRALAPEIRVVSVAPGWVLGDYAKSVDREYLQRQEHLTPLARLAKPNDVANTVFALDHLLKFTTGSVIPVDGGRSLN